MKLDNAFADLLNHILSEARRREFQFPNIVYDFNRKGIPMSTLSALLKNAWSAEYALSLQPIDKPEQTLKTTSGYSFPQAYYSVLFSARAFLLCQGIDTANENAIDKAISDHVGWGYYQPGLDFYVMSAPDFGFKRLAPTAPIRKPLAEIRNADIDNYFIANHSAERPSFYSNTWIALKSRDELSVEQYRIISRAIGTTTFFDLFKLLRIHSARPFVEAVDNGSIHDFYDQLSMLVNCVNAAHEFYVALRIGSALFRRLVESMPDYISRPVLIRYHSSVAPNLYALSNEPTQR